MKKDNKFLLLSIFFFIFLVPIILSNGIINNLNENNRYNVYSRDNVDTNLRISGFWKYSSIHIDDMGLNGNGSWTWASAQPWCSGSGTWNDPYIIENIEIDAISIANGILIENSNVYFIIKNTTIYNSGAGFTAGIKLSSTINGQLLYNNCSFNNRQGILLSNSNNNTIIGNILNNNTGAGIYLDVSDSNLLQNNTADNNGHWITMNSGIFISNSKNNTISGNFLNYNKDAGIKLKDTNDQNTIFNNTMFSNYYAGISLSNANNSLISNNRIEDTPQKGIELRSSHINVLIENTVKNCSTDGISICTLTGPSTFNIIADNNISGNYRGLLISGSSFNIISNNTLKNNTEGITLSGSVDNIILNNTINNNSVGLALFTNNMKNNISENTINFNGIGLDLYYSNYNIFLNNNFLNNSIPLSKTNSDENYFENNEGLNNTGPLPITLSSNNYDPDRDGDFDLSWSCSYGSDNFSVYIHDSYITEINSSVTNLITGYTQLTFPIRDLGNGTHFFKVVGFNKFGNQSSNCVNAIVIQERPASCLFGYAFNPNDLRLEIWWDLNHEADNYSIYISNSTITKIDGNVTEIITGLEMHSYIYYGLTNGSNFLVIIAYNEFGNRWLNFEVFVNLTIPGPFSLESIAGDPDDDGFFLLNWTDSDGALNYSIYMYNESITQINSSVSLIEDGQFGNFYSMNGLYNGTYYFKVVAFNRWGNRSSNCISVNVKYLKPFNFGLNNVSSTEPDGSFVLNWNASLGVVNYTISIVEGYISTFVFMNTTYYMFIATPGGVNITLIGITETSYRVSGLPIGSYLITITAYNIFGSFSSNTIQVNVPFEPFVGDELISHEGEDPLLIFKILLVILSIGSISAISGVSIHIYRQTKISPREEQVAITKRKKTLLKGEKSSVKTFNGLIENSKILHAFDEKPSSSIMELLKEIELTRVSKDFLEKVDNIGFNEFDKQEFIKEMLSLPEAERDEILENILKRIIQSG